MEINIKGVCSQINEAFADAINNVETREYTIDCSKISEHIKKRDEDIRYVYDFKDMFEDLDTKNERPAVYVFSVEDYKDWLPANEIVDVVKKLEHTPAIYKRKNQDKYKGVLYVGKVTGCCWGRLIQHFGVHRNEKSHGLQIAQWDQNVLQNLKLKFTIYFFDKKMRNYVELVEKELAKELNPIIGKH